MTIHDANASHAHLLTAARVVFGYKLLKVAADAVGIPRQEGLIAFPRVIPPQVCSDRMNKVRRSPHRTALRYEVSPGDRVP